MYIAVVVNLMISLWEILKIVTISFILLFLPLHHITCFSQESSPSVVVGIDSNGLVNVNVKLSLNEGLHEIILPVEPIPITIAVVGDDKDLPLIYEEGRLYIYLDKPLNININYIANITIENNVFYLNIKTPDVIELRISKEVILLSWPEENVVDIGFAQGILTLWIKGPITINYAIKLSTTQTSKTITTSTSPPPSTTAINTYESPTLATSTATPTFTNGLSKSMNLIIIAIIAASVSCVVVFYTLFIKKRKVGQSSILDTLGEVDIAIIKSLEARGGSAFQTELQNDINVPKTTLWRHIKKLEKLGIVKIEKIGLQNKVVLTKKIKLT